MNKKNKAALIILALIVLLVFFILWLWNSIVKNNFKKIEQKNITQTFKFNKEENELSTNPKKILEQANNQWLILEADFQKNFQSLLEEDFEQKYDQEKVKHSLDKAKASVSRARECMAIFQQNKKNQDNKKYRYCELVKDFANKYRETADFFYQSNQLIERFFKISQRIPTDEDIKTFKQLEQVIRVLKKSINDMDKIIINIEQFEVELESAKKAQQTTVDFLTKFKEFQQARLEQFEVIKQADQDHQISKKDQAYQELARINQEFNDNFEEFLIDNNLILDEMEAQTKEINRLWKTIRP
ncbi:MAG: hypothetical protein GF332_02520 [Candidatus Moranbacteria bacterium]|nr:hypothetical protein [Candidatus Moranbacteria bacterium]